MAVVNHNRKHDIRNAIPKTKFTDSEFFPEHVHRDYPMMLLKNSDDPKKPAPVPVRDEQENPIVVNDEGELETYLGNLDDEELVDQIRSHLPRNDAQRQQEESAAMKALIEENQRLKARLSDVGADDGAKVNALAGVTKSTPAKPPAGKPKSSLPQPLKAVGK